MPNLSDTKDGKKLENGFNYTGDKGPFFGVRYIQIITMSIVFSMGFATKAMFSVAIVAMTDNSTSSNINVPAYNWNNTNVILSAILWSGIPVNVLSGYLGQRFGPKWFFVGSSLLNHLSFMSIPLAAKQGGSTGVILCRVSQGLALGFLFPLISVVMGRWAPPEERSRIGFLSTAILTLTATASSISTGYIAQSSLGWPYVFYIFGTIGLAGTALYAVVGVQSTDHHKYITLAEKTYLQETLFKQTETRPIPWKKIFSSIYVWAPLVGRAGSYWFFIILSTELSIYLAKVLQFDLKTNGLVSALPSLLGTIAGIGLSFLSDYIPQKRILSLLNSRRCFHLVGTTTATLCLTFMTFVPVTHKMWAIATICLVHIFLMAAGVGGAETNMLDISPKYAGVIMGASQTISQGVALFGPLMVQWVCTDMTDPSQWRIVFLTSAIIAISTGIFFAIFATGDRQNWDEDENQEEAYFEFQKRKSSIISLTLGVAPL